MVKHEPYFFYVQIFGFVELKSPKRPVDEKSSVQGSVDGGWGGGYCRYLTSKFIQGGNM